MRWPRSLSSAAYYLREGHAILQQSGGRLAWSAKFAPYGALLLFILPIRLLALKYYDLYRLRGEFSFVEDSVRVFKATAIGSLLIVAATFLYRGGFQFRAFSYARGVFVLDFVLALGAFGVLRLARARRADVRAAARGQFDSDARRRARAGSGALH